MGMMIGGPLTKGVKLLLITTIGIWLLELIWVHWLSPGLTAPNMALASLPLPLVPAQVLNGQIWRLFTYMFLHDPSSPSHILLNMFGLWMFGGMLERRWGTRSFITFYILCGLAGGVGVMLGHILFGASGITMTIGASGAVYGLIVAFGIINANSTIYLMGILPMRAKTMVLILVGITFLNFLMRSNISFAAHAGGMIMGALLVTGYWRPSRLAWIIRRKLGSWGVGLGRSNNPESRKSQKRSGWGKNKRLSQTSDRGKKVISMSGYRKGHSGDDKSDGESTGGSSELPN